jgi:hypothetical protein
MAELVEAAEKIEEVTEPIVNEVIKTVRMIDRRVAFVAFGLALTGGALIGSALTERRVRLKYQQLADDEIDQMRTHFEAKLVAAEKKPDLEELVEDLGYKEREETSRADPATARIDYHKRAADEGESPAVVVENVNVFQAARLESEWDYATELKNRNPQQPYIIHKDEFMAGGEFDHEQITLTYFEGDEVLCDERDAQVDDPDMMVGLDNLERFGHGSGDVNVLYVRNEPLAVDVEINLSHGKFATEVHGFVDDELKHSERTRTPRRGFNDE